MSRDTRFARTLREAFQAKGNPVLAPRESRFYGRFPPPPLRLRVRRALRELMR